MPPVRLFISYAHEDTGHREVLEKSLAPLVEEGRVEVWSDGRILAGGAWDDKIREEVERADVVLFLVSRDLLASSYVRSVELERALERGQAGEAAVVPVIVRPSDWEGTALGQLQAIPTRGRPVTRWEDRDEAWLDVVRQLRRRIEEGGEPAGPPGSAADPVRRYLRSLVRRTSNIELRRLGGKMRLPLDRVYARLRARAAVGDEGRLEAGSVELADVLRSSPHAVLVGDPGSGKTTFLRFTAQLLAAELVSGEEEQRPAAAEGPARKFAKSRQIGGWTLQARNNSDSNDDQRPAANGAEQHSAPPPRRARLRAAQIRPRPITPQAR